MEINGIIHTRVEWLLDTYWVEIWVDARTIPIIHRVTIKRTVTLNVNFLFRKRNTLLKLSQGQGWRDQTLKRWKVKKRTVKPIIKTWIKRQRILD